MTEDKKINEPLSSDQSETKDSSPDLAKLPSFPSEDELAQWQAQQAQHSLDKSTTSQTDKETLKKANAPSMESDTLDSQKERVDLRERTAESMAEELEEERVEKLLDSLLNSHSENESTLLEESQIAGDETKEQATKVEVTDYFQHLKEKKQKGLPDDPKTRHQRQSAWSYLTPNFKEKQRRAFHDFPNYFYAGFWIRLYAFVVDLLCINAISALGLWLIPSTMINLQGIAIVESVIYLGYFILMTKLTNGQTIGKMIFGIQVVCFNEERLSWETVLVREGVCRFIMQVGPFVLAYLVTIFTGRKQHIGDLFSDTSVVTLNTLKAYNGISQ